MCSDQYYFSARSYAKDIIWNGLFKHWKTQEERDFVIPIL